MLSVDLFVNKMITSAAKKPQNGNPEDISCQIWCHLKEYHQMLNSLVLLFVYGHNQSDTLLNLLPWCKY